MNFVIFDNRHYIVEHCYSCAVPGYLIVSAKAEIQSMAQLSPAALGQLGPTLALAVALVTDIVKPVKVYCAQFGEASAHLHFHVFPRSEELTAAFVEAFPGQEKLIHGPLLLDWARSQYAGDKKEVWSAVSAVVTKMKAHDLVPRSL